MLCNSSSDRETHTQTKIHTNIPRYKMPIDLETHIPDDMYTHTKKIQNRYVIDLMYQLLHFNTIHNKIQSYSIPNVLYTINIYNFNNIDI